jgi:hypothetical protein
MYMYGPTSSIFRSEESGNKTVAGCSIQARRIEALSSQARAKAEYVNMSGGDTA